MRAHGGGRDSGGAGVTGARRWVARLGLIGFGVGLGVLLLVAAEVVLRVADVGADAGRYDPFAGFSRTVPMFEPATRGDGTAVLRTARARKVRFGVHPVPRRNDIAVTCVARLVDRREVRSSNGEREQRYVIETPIRMGSREWTIEVSLANRDTMSYRMLLGRRAIPRDMLVDPSSSFLQPKLRYKVYRSGCGRDAVLDELWGKDR